MTLRSGTWVCQYTCGSIVQGCVWGLGMGRPFSHGPSLASQDRSEMTELVTEGQEAGAMGAGRPGWAGAHGCPRRRPVCGPFPRLGFAARGRCGPSRETRQGSRVAPWDSRRGQALDCAQGTTSAGHLARRRAGGGRDASWRMRVAAVIVWFPMRGGPFMGGSRPARRRSEGGRGGGGGLRLVAVAGCGAASRPVGSASARAVAPGSVAGLPLSNVVG